MCSALRVHDCVMSDICTLPAVSLWKQKLQHLHLQQIAAPGSWDLVLRLAAAAAPVPAWDSCPIISILCEGRQQLIVILYQLNVPLYKLPKVHSDKLSYAYLGKLCVHAFGNWTSNLALIGCVGGGREVLRLHVTLAGIYGTLFWWAFRIDLITWFVWMWHLSCWFPLS